MGGKASAGLFEKVVKNCQRHHIKVFPIRRAWQFVAQKRGGGRGFMRPP
jgi:hypothetical protein